MSDFIGLDIGGANLKAARSDGECRSRPYALWKAPERLADELRALLHGWSAERWAVTMTGELCDCFENRRSGVRAILDAVATLLGGRDGIIWTTAGRFVTLGRARNEELACASANWLALATFAGRLAPVGAALLIDIGSTTTDIVPLRDGAPIPRGRTDFARMECGELIYTGVRRTPLCVFLGQTGAAELFATMLDVDLILRRIPDAADDCDTADGRPATRAYALARFARMFGTDADAIPECMLHDRAQAILDRQRANLSAHVVAAVERLDAPPDLPVITSGSGEQRASEVAGEFGRVISLGKLLGPAASQAACAHAVATLAVEGRHGP